ncbi:hypothetical protein ACIRNY_05590 [Capnocytophaga canimorsus]|uniref:Uncharacterized protein n=1 Tax=Capnocytophaga canis TaxID=1848903 RepID=A0A3A1YCT2_9FLAO|nr:MULTISPECIES: hypothetical protein [Capnocytophaga]RIY35952.1 hypothetical protein CKY20_08820 [Capnocytophaga canis]GIM58146.1 hypothetical protein CAPN007_03530 [Capnocytophaga canimorsus]
MNKTDILFKGNIKLETLSYFKEGDMWQFKFDDFVSLDTTCLWRLVVDSKIMRTSVDNEQYFTKENSTEIEKNLREVLKDLFLIEIELDTLSGDLFLIFTEKYKLQFFTNSSYYENWNLHIGNKQYICMGSGELALFSN